MGQLTNTPHPRPAPIQNAPHAHPAPNPLPYCPLPTAPSLPYYSSPVPTPSSFPTNHTGAHREFTRPHSGHARENPPASNSFSHFEQSPARNRPLIVSRRTINITIAIGSAQMKGWAISSAVALRPPPSR